MTPPAVLLCLQLVIVTTGSSWALPAATAAGTTTAKVDHTRLEALFPGGTSHSSSSSSSPSTKGSPAVVSRSKRQPWMPTLIDSGDDSFAYRQHHQPPPGLHHRQHSGLHYQQQQQQQHRFHQPPPEDFGTEDYDQYQDHSSEIDSTGDDNEIGDNPFYTASAAATGPESSPGSPGNPVVGHAPATPVESIDLIREQLERVKEEEDIEIKSELLMKLLEQLPEGPLPIVYIEDAGGSETAAATMGTENGAGGGGEPSGVDPVGQVERFTANGDKRSGRYYRRYPWKRQNARARTYDADARYLCVPSREDVFKLLVGLHENRIGNHQKTINFCNRKRPAKAIFTNIRFLG
uniref:Putative conserved secreted protein n=2 Tax=Culex tarsalis TaxID=7177 RepID=A0A1Q3FZ70_CULTA